jgi:hypothetical protein
MKHFSLIFTWSLAIAMSLCLRGAVRLQADPTDDFSFSLGRAPQQQEVDRLMSVRKVTDILVDHLDLFPRSQAPKLARHLLNLCHQYRFDPAFVLSLIQVESGFHIKIVSPSGAVGLMQIMPGTGLKVARDLGLVFKKPVHSGETSLVASERVLKDPFVNLTLGVAYLAWLRDHYKGLSPYYLVAAYNVGPARLDELLSRKSFEPVNTKKYFQAIRRGVPGFRYYRRAQVPALIRKPVRRPRPKAPLIDPSELGAGVTA